MTRGTSRKPKTEFNGHLRMNRHFMMDWEREFLERVASLGGFVNFHAHLDRAGTFREEYLSHVGMNPREVASYSLPVKQSAAGYLHSGLAYTDGDLEARLSRMLELSVHYGTKEIWSPIDTTADEARNALEVALKVKDKYKSMIDFKVGAYPIFGFKDSEPERWEIFKAGAEKADFIMGLPERDLREGHVGYDEHLRRLLTFGRELQKPVQVHVDQMNHPSENGTETLVQAVRWLWPEQGYEDGNGEPMVWAVHAISPSGYDEERFGKLLDDLEKYNVGIVSCPGAAIGMRQLRPIKTPTHNSIARVKEMIVRGIPVRFGTDNIEDFLMPSGHPNMFYQMWRATDDLRMYDSTVLAKLAAGAELNEVDREAVRNLLDDDQRAFESLKTSYEVN